MKKLKKPKRMGFFDSVAGTQLIDELDAEYLIRIGRKNELGNYEPHVIPHHDHNILRPGSMDAYHLPNLSTQGRVWPQR